VAIGIRWKVGVSGVLDANTGDSGVVRPFELDGIAGTTDSAAEDVESRSDVADPTRRVDTRAKRLATHPNRGV
jgi:hypothetical protein